MVFLVMGMFLTVANTEAGMTLRGWFCLYEVYLLVEDMEMNVRVTKGQGGQL